MPDSAGVRVRAFAKINVSLRVLSARSDGYHQLRTTFQSIALHDTLTFTALRGPFRIECRDPSVPLDRTNLIWRAAERLWRERERDRTHQGRTTRVADQRRRELAGVRVRLVKRVPIQAGLAGGSSDAAATLRALVKLWRLTIDEGALSSIARELGADVPYFLVGGTARGEGRGDRIHALDDPPRAWVVIARPSFGVSTAEAFSWWDAMAGTADRSRSREGVSEDAVDFGVNDLEPAVVGKHPQIGRLIDTLRAAQAQIAAMSGSGSAVFGLFATEAAARRAAGRVGAEASVRVWVTETVSRARFSRLSAPRRS